MRKNFITQEEPAIAELGFLFGHFKTNEDQMRIKRHTTRLFLFTIFLIFIFQHEIFAQEADSSKVKQPGLFVGFTMGSAQSRIINKGMLSVSDQVNGKKTSWMGSLEVGYFFSNFFGLSSGISFISCKGLTTLSSYQNNFNTTDSEQESYQRQVSGINVTELQNIGFLGIPICLNIRVPFNKKFGMFLQTGLEVEVPLVKKYHSSGTFTYKGYYPAYNVLLENLPAYGFPSNTGIVTDGQLQLKSLCLGAIAAAGFDFFIQKKFQIALAASYNRSLSNISAYTLPEKFQLSSDLNQVNSLMGGSNKTTAQSLGLSITLRYFLNKRW